MNSLKRTIRGALTTAVIAGSSVSGAAVWAGQQQQQPAGLPKVVRKSGAVLQASATRRVEPESGSWIRRWPIACNRKSGRRQIVELSVGCVDPERLGRHL